MVEGKVRRGLRPKHHKIHVLGSINVDFVVAVPALPQAGETVVGGRLVTAPGGKGANQAVAAARLGADVRLVARVGVDASGDEALRALAEDHVDITGVVRDTTSPTGAALVIVENGGQNVIAVAPGANAQVGHQDVDRLIANLRTGDIVVLQLEVPVVAVLAAARRAKAAGATVILNAAPGRALASVTTLDVDLLVVNQTELTAMTGMPATDVESAAAAAARLTSVADAVVVTLGAGGALFKTDESTEQIQPYQVAAIDSTGAGDAFLGGLAFGLAIGKHPLEAARLACAAGAAAVTRFGARASLPNAERLRELFGVDLSRSVSSGPVGTRLYDDQ